MPGAPARYRPAHTTSAAPPRAPAPSTHKRCPPCCLAGTCCDALAVLAPLDWQNTLACLWWAPSQWGVGVVARVGSSVSCRLVASPCAYCRPARSSGSGGLGAFVTPTQVLGACGCTAGGGGNTSSTAPTPPPVATPPTLAASAVAQVVSYTTGASASASATASAGAGPTATLGASGFSTPTGAQPAAPPVAPAPPPPGGFP